MNDHSYYAHLRELAKAHNRTVDLLILTTTIASLALIIALLAFYR